MTVPFPFLLLLGAALAASAFDPLSLDVAEPVAVAALVVILLTGGVDIHEGRMRATLGTALSLGVLGTFVTAGAVAALAHAVLGFGWTEAGLLGAALAPTDPAMVFAVLKGRALRARPRLLLEGEAGFNDPAGIALMLGLIELATHAEAGFGVVVGTFALQMGLGTAFGLAGGLVLRRVGGLVPLLAAAAALYGATAVLGGSGFLAVFVAGLMHDDVRGRAVTGRVAEAVVFVALGLTVAVTELPADAWRDGLILAVLLAVAARPAAVGLTLFHVTGRERAFIAFAGLKGAVPILLGALAVLEGVGESLYGVVFVAVAVNVLVQGTLLGAVASRLDVATER
jgi:cell volume regulation protein A